MFPFQEPSWIKNQNPIEQFEDLQCWIEFYLPEECPFLCTDSFSQPLCLLDHIKEKHLQIDTDGPQTQSSTSETTESELETDTDSSIQSLSSDNEMEVDHHNELTNQDISKSPILKEDKQLLTSYSNPQSQRKDSIERHHESRSLISESKSMLTRIFDNQVQQPLETPHQQLDHPNSNSTQLEDEENIDGSIIANEKTEDNNQNQNQNRKRKRRSEIFHQQDEIEEKREKKKKKERKEKKRKHENQESTKGSSFSFFFFPYLFLKNHKTKYK